MHKKIYQLFISIRALQESVCARAVGNIVVSSAVEVFLYNVVRTVLQHGRRQWKHARGDH